MKRVFLIEYAIILFMNINARLNPKIIEYPQMVLYFFNVLYIMMLIFELRMPYILKGKWVLKRNASISGFFILIFMMYLLSLFNGNSSIEQGVLSVMLLSMVFATAKMINELSCLKDYICVSFFETTVIFVIICLKNNVNITAILFTNIVYLLGISSVRVRVDFTFYNVNAAANLLACILSISCIANWLLDKVLYKLFYWISAFFLFLLLLSTGSRTAVFSICLCIFLLLMHRLMKFKSVQSEQRFLCRVFIILSSVLILYYTQFERFFNKYVISRGGAYDNINLLQSPKSKLIGYGLVAPGKFMDIKIKGIKGFYLDNYYVYIYVTMGIIGLLVMMSFFIYIGSTLIKYSAIHNEYFRILICYIACMVSGIAETSVFYYLFPSSFIYFSIFISCLYRKGYQISSRRFI